MLSEYDRSVRTYDSILAVDGYLSIFKLRSGRYYDLEVVAVFDDYFFGRNVGVDVLCLIGLVLEAPAPYSVAVIYTADYPVVASSVAVGVVEALALALAPVVRVSFHICVGVGDVYVGELVERCVDIEGHGIYCRHVLKSLTIFYTVVVSVNLASVNGYLLGHIAGVAKVVVFPGEIGCTHYREVLTLALLVR